MVRDYAFMEWSKLAWLGRTMTKLSARVRGAWARRAFAERMFMLRNQQARHLTLDSFGVFHYSTITVDLQRSTL